MVRLSIITNAGSMFASRTHLVGQNSTSCDGTHNIEIEYAKNCLECRYYTNKDDDVLDYVISLDGQLLDVDQIHVVYDWNAVPSDGLNTNCLFLQKDNYVIRIGFKTVTVLDDQTLKLFVELFDRLPALFM